MLLVSHKMVFHKIEAALLCVTMRKPAREMLATVSCKHFHIAFAINKLNFCNAHFKRIFPCEGVISKR